MLARRIRTDGFIEPSVPTIAHKPPSGPGWVHEIKHDGYRLIVRREGRTVRLFTRRGHDWTDRYPAIAAVARSPVSPVPARGDHERRPPSGSRLGAVVRAEDGVHEMRGHRRRCQAELAGARSIAARKSYPQPDREPAIPARAGADVRERVRQEAGLRAIARPEYRWEASEE
jgi:ATP dependent DNA ligase domain